MGTYRHAYQPPALGTHRTHRAACPQAPTYCTYGIRVPASGVGYVPRTVAPQELPQQMGELVLMRKLMLSNNRTLTRTARRMRMCTACARCCVRVLRVGTVHARTYAGLGALPRSTALRWWARNRFSSSTRR